MRTPSPSTLWLWALFTTDDLVFENDFLGNTQAVKPNSVRALPFPTLQPNGAHVPRQRLAPRSSASGLQGRCPEKPLWERVCECLFGGVQDSVLVCSCARGFARQDVPWPADHWRVSPRLDHDRPPALAPLFTTQCDNWSIVEYGVLHVRCLPTNPTTWRAACV